MANAYQTEIVDDAGYSVIDWHQVGDVREEILFSLQQLLAISRTSENFWITEVFQKIWIKKDLGREFYQTITYFFIQGEINNNDIFYQLLWALKTITENSKVLEHVNSKSSKEILALGGISGMRQMMTSADIRRQIKDILMPEIYFAEPEMVETAQVIVFTPSPPWTSRKAQEKARVAEIEKIAREEWQKEEFLRNFGLSLPTILEDDLINLALNNLEGTMVIDSFHYSDYVETITIDWKTTTSLTWWIAFMSIKDLDWVVLHYIISKKGEIFKHEGQTPNGSKNYIEIGQLEIQDRDSHSIEYFLRNLGNRWTVINVSKVMLNAQHKIYWDITDLRNAERTDTYVKWWILFITLRWDNSKKYFFKIESDGSVSRSSDNRIWTTIWIIQAEQFYS